MILTSLGELKEYEKNQTVFFQNDDGDDMYIVLKGTFSVDVNSFTGFPRCIAEIKKGSFFGEMSIIDDSPRSATVTSIADSSVIVIRKENFGSLLERAPEIASGIMNVMRMRALSTAEAVRRSGKKVPELPPILKIVKYRDVESSLHFLAMLAEKIREMNSILVESTEPEVPEPESKEEYDSSAITLLPDGYIYFNTKDNNIDVHLREASVICPYCKMAFKTHIPLFTGLKKSKEALDGRIIYKGLNILLYTNIICANCNYSDTYLEFGKIRKSLPTPLYKGNQFINEEGFTGYVINKDRTIDEAILSYYLNIKCLMRTSGDPLRFANAWIRLYWLYSDHDREDFAKDAAENAKYYYSKYAEQNAGSLPDNDKVRLNTILGELSATLEMYDNALTHYEDNLVIMKDSKPDNIKDIERRIEELKKLIRA